MKIEIPASYNEHIVSSSDRFKNDIAMPEFKLSGSQHWAALIFNLVIEMDEYDAEKMYNGIVTSILKPEKVINQCTEKEFPSFEMIDNNNFRFNIHRDFPMNGAIINFWTEDKKLLLTNEQFKQFAEGVNKIVEYLDAND